MKRFVVTLQGENFLIDVNGEPRKIGFKAIRFVWANDPQHAEKIAVILIHKSPEIRGMVENSKSDPPRIHVVNIAQETFWRFFRLKRKDSIEFYEEDPFSEK